MALLSLVNKCYTATSPSLLLHYFSLSSFPVSAEVHGKNVAVLELHHYILLHNIQYRIELN